MNEEAITWNLRGPKRMRKRRELNALLKNNHKYRSMFKHNSSIDMFNLNSGASRLLNKSNDSSTDNDEFYFSANKSVIREKKRKNCCKIIQMILVGFVITFGLIAGVILMFSYSKFNNALNTLKTEFQSQKELSQQSINEVKRQLNEYDSMFKKLSKIESNLQLNNNRLNDFISNNKDYEKYEKSSTNSSNVKNRATLLRSIRSIDMTNRLNTYLIEWLFNRSSLVDMNNTEEASDKKPNSLIELILNDYKQNGKEFNFASYNRLVNNFLKNKEQFTWMNNTNNFLHRSFKEYTFKEEIINDIETLFIKPILETLESCECKKKAIR